MYAIFSCYIPVVLIGSIETTKTKQKYSLMFIYTSYPVVFTTQLYKIHIVCLHSLYYFPPINSSFFCVSVYLNIQKTKITHVAIDYSNSLEIQKRGLPLCHCTFQGVN